MKRTLLMVTVLGTALAGGWVAAQSPPAGGGSAPRAKAEGKGAEAKGTSGHGMMGKGIHGQGMMGQGMMGMGGMCPMMVGRGTKVEVKNLPKGATMTFTNDNAETVARLQKMAEAMRLMHEAHAQ
jgi:hypothetical protein